MCVSIGHCVKTTSGCSAINNLMNESTRAWVSSVAPAIGPAKTGRAPRPQHMHGFYVMQLCMRTTLDIEGKLLRRARRKAAKTRTTLSKFIEDALRQYLGPNEARSKRAFAARWPVVRGVAPPLVDI